MIDQWILEKIEPLKPASPIILQDPQRILEAGTHVVDGWAEENGYSVFFCTGNLALREMVEASRHDPDAQILVVDRSRKDAAIPLFYPDLMAHTKANARLELDLQAYLIEKTGDEHWPALVNDRKLSRLILDNLPQVIETHSHLRAVDSSRFSDSDLYKIMLGSALEINPFQKLSTTQARRLAIHQHRQLDELNRLLPSEIMAELHQSIAKVPKPFCWLLERDPDLVVRAFTLSALMHQHDLPYRTLLVNIDPTLHDYRDIDAQFIEKTISEQIEQEPERLLSDVASVDESLRQNSAALEELLSEHLQLDDPADALEVLQNEKLSELVRSLALLSLLADLLQNRKVTFHEKVQTLLSEQSNDPTMLALRQPSGHWRGLVDAHNQALVTLRLSRRSVDYAKEFRVTGANKLDFAIFHKLWNEEQLNRLDYYTSDLKRVLRVGDILPVPLTTLWPTLQERWEAVRKELAEIVEIVDGIQQILNHRFQDLYKLHYTDWIRQSDAPVIFTHQVLDRLLKANWDPTSGQKAIVMVFDGMRPDAWEEFLRPVFEERFVLIESRPGSAILPTETHLSRKAIAAGCLPDQFVSNNELKLFQNWLKTSMNLTPQFDTIQNDDTKASGMTAHFTSKPVDYIIFNFSDKNLHNNDQELAFIYNTTLREIIRQDVRAVLRELPADALIIITSDHGFTPVPKDDFTVPKQIIIDRQDVKFRCARAVSLPSGNDAQKVVAFNAADLGIPIHSQGDRSQNFSHMLFPRPTVGMRRPSGRHKPDPYNHGGLSLAECMVPMVVMGPLPSQQPPLEVSRFAQKGVARENEEVLLEVEIRPSLAANSDKASATKTITLNFSRNELPERREFFGGKTQTYTIRWRPNLDATPEQRQAGEVVLSITLILSYSEQGKTVRESHSTEIRIKFDSTRLHRRVDSKLNLLMGKVPKGLRA